MERGAEMVAAQLGALKAAAAYVPLDREHPAVHVQIGFVIWHVGLVVGDGLEAVPYTSTPDTRASAWNTAAKSLPPSPIARAAVSHSFTAAVVGSGTSS